MLYVVRSVIIYKSQARDLGARTTTRTLPTARKMNSNNHYISANIYATDPMATLFESSMDSATATAEQQPPTQTNTAETRQAQL